MLCRVVGLETRTAYTPNSQIDFAADWHETCLNVQGDRGPPGLPGGLGEEWIERIRLLKASARHVTS